MRGSGPRPRRRFGQNFLERAWVEKVVAAIAPQPADTFLEIGPGRGALTWPLSRIASRVIGFEIDRDLAAALQQGAGNVTIEEGDFLDVPADRITSLLPDPATGALRVAGNLPYNVASPILFRLTALYRAGLPLTDATLMLQREVAERLTAPPGTRDYGVLSVLIRHAADVELLLSLPPGAFRPSPKVHSSLVRLRFHPDRPPARNRAVFEALTQAIFTRRRKTLANALRAYALAETAGIPALLARTGIDGRRRPETLDVSELVVLADTVAAVL
jgi:16S rRNA (adenine1518-N6/adenine1519-N6)-dimethyltransferase